MRHLKYVFAAAALGSLIALPQVGFAGPLPGGLLAGSSTPVVADDLVQKVHGWHCGKRKGWYHGHRVWHRHYRACHRSYYDDSYYDDNYYDDYSYYRPYRRHYAYPYYPGPFIGFSFGGGRHGGWDWDD
jgi:hypothetical protein